MIEKTCTRCGGNRLEAMSVGTIKCWYCGTEYEADRPVTSPDYYNEMFQGVHGFHISTVAFFPVQSWDK